jgi:hypothetical protein
VLLSKLTPQINAAERNSTGGLRCDGLTHRKARRLPAASNIAIAFNEVAAATGRHRPTVN